jgi:hypothetical protein
MHANIAHAYVTCGAYMITSGPHMITSKTKLLGHSLGLHDWEVLPGSGTPIGYNNPLYTT